MSLLTDLEQIGFTEYEAKVYLALLHTHPATGYQLSKESGVPRSMVYEALKRLHARGAALESVEDRTTLYKPLEPGALLTRHEAAYRQVVDRLRTGLETLYEASGDDRVWTIIGRRTALSYAAQLIGRAKAEAYLVLTDADLETLEPEIKEADVRGVSIKALLTGSGTLDCGQVVYHPPLESELHGLTTTLLVVSDESEALIAGAGQRMDTVATVTRNADLILLARQFVWMEFFTQRVYARIGPDLLERLGPEERQIFESLPAHNESTDGDTP